MPIGVKMIRNSFLITLYILLLMLIVFFEYQKNNTFSKKIIVQKYEITDNRALDIFLLEHLDSLDSHIMINKLWKIIPPKVKIKTIKNREINKTKIVEVTLNNKTICIEKKCFKLLGIFLDRSYSSSFYIKEAKKKIQTFKVEEILASTIKIKTINRNNIVFEDRNSTREWIIKLLDINVSKYKPKEFKE